MIITKFQEQTAAAPDNIAIKMGNRTVTYSELNTYGNQLANAIITNEGNRDGDIDYQRVSLLFEHGVDMIISVIGTLKAGKTYVPLDIDYPEKRLAYMLEDSQSHLILTDTANVPLARRLTGQIGNKADIINIDSIDMKPAPTANIQREAPGDGDRLAYILYTSGSTGRPKGVMQTHRNVLYYTGQWIRRFAITGSDRMTFITSFSHDQSVQDIFASLLSGACLYPYNLRTASNTYEFYGLLMGEKITIWHSVPSVFRFFANSLTSKDQFYDMRWLLLGGEALQARDLELFKAHFPKALIGGIYGQTESSFNSVCMISPEDTFDDVSLGETLDEMELLLVNEDGELVDDMGVGEIVVDCDYIAPGYWGDKKNSERIFLHNEELGRLYRTGDLGRFTARGTIKMVGREDSQVKIRGFRVEIGEIETQLLQHPEVKEAVIVAKEDEKGDTYLCAYLVSHESIPSSRLREYLSRELPDYMIPRHFIHLEQMPRTPNGKIDKKSLPDPDKAAAAEAEYEPPGNETQEKLVAIWQEVLGVEKVGINDHFIDLGGHSLVVISIIAKIHQVFDVELQLRDVFDNPTIKQLSRLVLASEVSGFSSIHPTEKKKYYALTSDQKRIFVLNQFEGIGTTYNLPAVIQLEGDINRQRFEETFQKLIKRHEALRTSFEMNEDEPVQVIHEKVDFQIHYIDAETGIPKTRMEIKKIVKDFIQPFVDLSKAPLLRVSLIKRSKDKHILLIDTHHIIVDGMSHAVLAGEFSRLYAGEELSALRLNYKDYSEWHNKLLPSGQLKKQEEYWLDRFKGEIPVLKLPCNYTRPAVQEFAGDILVFRLGEEMSRQLNQLVKETDATLFIVLLAIYNVLLHKYTLHEDIVVGSIIAGRNHVDLENIIGIFVNTLLLRNYPAADKTFAIFLEEVKDNTLKAFENQKYPFNQLVEKLVLKKDRSRNPLFDAAFILQNTRSMVTEKNPEGIGLKSTLFGYENKTAKFDLTFEAIEIENEIVCSFQYRTKLFKRETIELMKERFLALTASILDDREKRIQDLDYRVSIENEMNEIQEMEFDF